MEQPFIQPSKSASLYTDRIMLCEFSSTYEVCATFMRLQEFYESPLPEIQDRVFTHEEFMDAYAKKSGEFNYFGDWRGFNLTGKCVVDFWTRFQILGTFWRKEQWLFDELHRLIPDWQSNISFFVMGVYAPEKEELIIHELSHGYWYLDYDYQQLMLPLLFERTDLTIKIKPKLIEWGYTENIMEDELVAYMSTSDASYMKEKFGFIEKDFKRLLPMIEAFTKYNKERKDGS